MSEIVLDSPSHEEDSSDYRRDDTSLPGRDTPDGEYNPGYFLYSINQARQHDIERAALQLSARITQEFIAKEEAGTPLDPGQIEAFENRNNEA